MLSVIDCKFKTLTHIFHAAAVAFPLSELTLQVGLIHFLHKKHGQAFVVVVGWLAELLVHGAGCFEHCTCGTLTSSMCCRELSFKKGDAVNIIRQVDNNWYEGEHRGRIGIFPMSYVEVCAESTLSTGDKNQYVNFIQIPTVWTQRLTNSTV